MFLRAICTLIAFVIPFIGEAKIVETITIESVIPYIDADTWLLVDLDNTMFEGKQALGHTEWFYDKAYAMMREEGVTLDEATRRCYPEWVEIQKICPVKYIEEGFIPALMQLQERGLVMMGLTQRQPSLAQSTVRQLASLGWTFQESAPEKKSFSIPTDTPTTYTNGILFTGEFNKKGETFMRFLSMIKQMPKKVVFIDDKRSHVDEVEKVLAQHNIEYVGVHYTAHKHVDKVYYPEVAEYQRKFMTKVMSNEAALLLMQHELE